MKLLGASVYARYLEQHGQSVEFPEDGYRGTYVEHLAIRLGERLGSSLLNLPPEQAEARCRELGWRRQLLQLIREDLARFGVTVGLPLVQ